MTGILIFLALSACTEAEVDADGDGVLAAQDCDDTNPEINPDAEEVCDGVDNNCDGEVDLGAVDAEVWYPDLDGDGYGDSSEPTPSCEVVGALILDGSDCDDTAVDISPDALEYCDGVDNNCDGVVDEDSAEDTTTYYEDADGDGYGVDELVVQACALPSGYAEVGGDCDETNASSQSCVCSVSSVDAPVDLVISGSTHGQWMTDALETLGAGLVWEMDFYNGNTLVEYASVADLVSGTPSSSTSLGLGYDGTGAVVYDGFLYYNQTGTNTLVEYDIAAGAVNSVLELKDAGYQNAYPYLWGGYTDIDFAVDENGLWVTYSNEANRGRLVLSALHAQPLALGETWNTDSPQKSSIGDSFVVCGVLYATDSYNGEAANINFAYDTVSESSSDPALSIRLVGGYQTQLDYNPSDGLLYSWNWSRHQTYVVNY